MNAHYQIYHDSIVQLAATLVIKDLSTCQTINADMARRGYTVLSDRPETWKYYLNLAGRYHEADRRMTVVSMDTQEDIEFTLENMAIHRATWREYRFGTRYYKELVSRYPFQEDLINGILNPVDISAAIAAPDHSILYYDRSLVESRETNLIPLLQRWIDAQFGRWANEDYQINNPLFLMARFAILSMALVQEIKNIRRANARTDMAHSFHIRRYLASFGGLDTYYDAMTEKQRLYFYRNIRYIQRNSGKDEMFAELTDRVLTDRRFPLADYKAQQTDDDILDTLDPGVQFLRQSINGIASALGEDVKDTKALLALQDPLAKLNYEESFDAVDYIPKAIARSMTAESKTKVLESNVLDLRESEPYTLSEVLLNEWIYLADIGYYTTILTLQLPNGADVYKLTMKEAYLIYQYLYMRRLGIEMVTIPRIMAKRVRRMPLPTFQELRQVTSVAITPSAYIHEALRDNIDIQTIVSVESFVRTCETIQARMMKHRDLYCYCNDLHRYAEVRAMTDRFYADIPVDMDNGQNYADWLAMRSISFEGYSPAELDEIMLNILGQATGINLRVAQTLKDIHAAMLGIMTQMSSYSVQYIQQINEEAVTMFDWPHLRWHHMGSKLFHDAVIPIGVAGIADLHASAKWSHTLDISGAGIQAFDQKASNQFSHPLGISYEMSGKNQFIAKGQVLGVMIGAITQPPDNLSSLSGKTLRYPEMDIGDISTLFERTTANDFISI